MKIENLYTPDCIRTFTGIYMNVFEPTPDMVCIEDIAHALSNMPRFAGHLPKFYSVAEHSYMCAVAAPQHKKLKALLHDASEAYLMDIPKPIKMRMPDYKIIEDNLMKVIAKKFGFEYPLCDEIHKIDSTLLELEWNELMLKKAIGTFKCYSPVGAKTVFMIMYDEITKK